MSTPGFIYVFAEGTPDEMLNLAEKGVTPCFYKVGKACTGSASFSPVEYRQGRAQSCNVRPINCLKVFQFQDIDRTNYVEKEFHDTFRKSHCAGKGGGIEWYKSSLTIEAIEHWMSHKKGIDITKKISRRIVNGLYEEGSLFKKKVNIYLMELHDDGIWYRVLASGQKGKANSWYNTGNYRPVVLNSIFVSSVSKAIQDANNDAKRIMETLQLEFGQLQSQLARKPKAGWHTLAWIKSSTLPVRLESLATKYGFEACESN